MITPEPVGDHARGARPGGPSRAFESTRVDSCLWCPVCTTTKPEGRLWCPVCTTTATVPRLWCPVCTTTARNRVCGVPFAPLRAKRPRESVGRPLFLLNPRTPPPLPPYGPMLYRSRPTLVNANRRNRGTTPSRREATRTASPRTRGRRSGRPKAPALVLGAYTRPTHATTPRPLPPGCGSLSPARPELGRPSRQETEVPLFFDAGRPVGRGSPRGRPGSVRPFVPEGVRPVRVVEIRPRA